MATQEFSETEIQEALQRIRKNRARQKEYQAKRSKDPVFQEKQKSQRDAYNKSPQAVERRKRYYANNKEAMLAYRKKYQDRNRKLASAIRAKAKELNMTIDEYLAAAG